VPILGEMMTTRWAFEAVMVRQFKDNEFEKHFYPFDKVKANADYKTGYYLKQLETNLEEANAALRGEVSREQIKDQLDLINHELHKELALFGAENRVDWQMLQFDKFDSAASDNIKKQLNKLNALYNKRKNTAIKQIDSLKNQMTATKQLEREYFYNKNTYTNDQVIDIVAHQGLVLTPILEVGNSLIRKITPIFATPEIPRNAWNFRTFYYAPQKYFAGKYFDTYWFNMLIIWIMALFALLALYIDLLKKFLLLFSKIGEYKYRKQFKKAQLSFKK
jgi:uncharacterized phage infection (PIP) family protein YhgE